MNSEIIVDVFMLTNTKNKEYFEITRDAILSLKASENIGRFKIYLIESNVNSNFHDHYTGLGCELILFNDTFSFSKTMNYALRHGKNRYALLTNNDVKFDENWFDEMSKFLNLKDVAVWSAHDPETNFTIEPEISIIEGYKPYNVHSGWCYLIDVEKLGNNRFLSEDFTTWYMDDDFCMRLQNMGLKQVMCRNSIVYHLGGRSNEIREDFKNKIEQDRLTFIKKYKDQIRIHDVRFLEDKTVINFESFGDGEYEFRITGDVNYQTKITMSADIYYYISVEKSSSLILEISNTSSKFYLQRYTESDKIQKNLKMKENKSNLKIEVVVSKYQEDLSWLSELKDIDKITIYDKSDNPSPNSISLPNFGREAHTYLYHIVNNYDNLSDYVIFLQGNPKDHLTQELNILSNLPKFDDFYPLNIELSCDMNGLPHHDMLEIDKIIFNTYFIDKPETISFTVGAQFIVSRRSILSRKREFYELLIKDFDRSDISNHCFNCNKMPWVLERVWGYIFDSNYKTKYDSLNNLNNIYRNFENILYPDLQGWNGNSEVFHLLIDECKPSTIIEVGTWKGQSAINMANYLKKKSQRCRIFCVDTWLGALEFWTKFKDSPDRNLLLKNGYPQIYYQFLSNVIHNGVEDYITPFPNTSKIGAKYFISNNISAELIYIDASHEEDDVYDDIVLYYQILKSGGVIFGDDYMNIDFPGVSVAVNRFCDSNGISYEILENNFWVIRKK